MSEFPEALSAAPEPTFPEGTVDAGVYASHAEGFERGVVVLAMGEACWLVEADGLHHLRVEAAAAGAVRHQLSCYERESVGWPPPPVVDFVPPRRHAPLSPLLWVLSIFAVFWAQGAWPALTEEALLDVERVFVHGEAWRVATALWLHADLGHLISNAGGGLLVFAAVISTLGFRAGWWSLATASLLGNLAAAALHHHQTYRSLGASTAVFAGVGILAGRSARVLRRSGHPHRWRTLLTPLVAGLSVLGLFGAGGVNIDVLAHATGFTAGTLIGLIASRPAHRPASTH